MTLSTHLQIYQPLTVREIRKEECALTQSMLSRWESIAKRIPKELPMNSNSIAKLEDCEIICFIMNENIRTAVEEDSSKILIAEDIQGKPQAIIFFREPKEFSCLEIVNLVTNPENLIPEEARNQNSPLPTRGTAKVLVETAIRRAVSIGARNLLVKSLPSAYGFYQKIGFDFLNPNQGFDTGSIPMILTMEKISAIYPSFIVSPEAA